MDRSFAVRLGCYALISAIESDFRRIIIGFHDYFIPEDVRVNANERFRRDGATKASDADDSYLLDYIDFGDIAKIVACTPYSKEYFDKKNYLYLISELESLTKARNRVCHSRPLESDDFHRIFQFSSNIVEIPCDYPWSYTKKSLGSINDPSFSLGMSIPSFWRRENSRCHNNLPLPEFDDTGFLGRKGDREKVKRLISSSVPVISIVGEGGVGKSALAMRCLYDYLDMENENPFEIIAWVSLKTNRLTAAGVKAIDDAISDATGMYKEIADILGADYQGGLDSIKEYMTHFKVLLCLDNFETIHSEEVREFLVDIPFGSKVLVTSRIGLGEIEYRYKLDRLSDSDAVNLMNKVASVVNLDANPYRSKFDSWCKKLFNNPLLIKWFILSLSIGKSPSTDILAKNGSFGDAVKFCFENLYDRIGDIERDIINYLACSRSGLSAVEIKHYFGSEDELKIQNALHVLKNSSMLTSLIGDEIYSLTEIAQDFVNKFRPVTSSFYSDFKKKKTRLQSVIERDLVKNSGYKLDLSAIEAFSRDELICATYLRGALDRHSSGDDEGASALLDKAKVIMPQYSECYRVSSYILSESKPAQAMQELQTALECNPGSLKALYAFAQACFSEGAYGECVKTLDEAIKIDGEISALKTYKAKALMYKGEYGDSESIFDSVIDNISSISYKKFRVSTYDLALECQRRKLERAGSLGDQLAIVAISEKSVFIMNLAFSSKDFDLNFMKRGAKFLAECCSSGNEDAFNNIKYFLFSIDDMIVRGQILSDCVSLLQEKLDEGRFKGFQGNIRSFISEASSFTGIVTENYVAFEGSLRSLNKDDAGRVRFGFVDGDNGLQYFFHRGACSFPAIFDAVSSDAVQYCRVSFIPFLAEKGWTGNQVRLLEEGDGVFLGTLHVITGKTNKGVYGYIRSSAGEKIFFHSRQALPNGWISENSIGALVRYRIGSNKLGICAVAIEKI